MSLPLTSRVLDAAEKRGLTVSYDENCGTFRNGLVTITHPTLQGQIVVEVKCARGYGLCFVPDRSSYKTLQDTIDALGIGAVL